MYKSVFLPATLISTLLLGACAGEISPEEVRRQGEYWQRSDSTSSLYMRGPKAQHQLNSDIAHCVSSTKELQRLGSIREASPPDSLAMTGSMKSNWDSPPGDGPMHSEYMEYHDFETCMVYNGWERVDYVAPVIAQRAANNYSETVLGIEFPNLWEPKHAQPRGANDFNN